MFLNVAPSLSADPDKRCPHLGLSDDPATAHGFPSWWNSCQNVKPIASPTLVQQREFCLTTKHAFCPVFEDGQKKSLPKELRMRKVGANRKQIGRWITVVVSLTFLIIGGLIFSGYWVPYGADKTSIPAWISRVIPHKIITNTPTEVRETEPPTMALETATATPGKSIVSETPSPSREDLAATQTKLVLGRDCAYPLDSPFGAEKGQFLLHKVVEGENMTILTERYETTQNAIEAVNYFFPSSLWADLVIVIPISLTNTDNLPAFKPVLLDEEDISLEELAQDLLVSSSELIEFNQIDPSCRSFQGWILVPAEKLVP